MPLTPAEAASLKSQQNAIVDQFTAGPTPTPTPTPSPTPAPTPTPTPSPTPPAGTTLIAWPTPAQGFTRLNSSAPRNFYFTIPAGFPSTYANRGRLQIGGASPPVNRTSTLYATLGGPVLTPGGTASGQAVTLYFEVGKVSPYYPNLTAGQTYYLNVSEPAGPVTIDLYPPH